MHSRSAVLGRSRGWRRAILAWLTCVAVAAPIGVGARQVCLRPVSLTPLLTPDDGALPPGADIDPLLMPVSGGQKVLLKSFVDAGAPARTLTDSLYYWSHAALGSALATGRCDPAASGVQWVKAAAHAASVAEADRVAGGVARALRDSPQPLATAWTLCLAASPRSWSTYDSMSATLALGGLYCNARVAPPDPSLTGPVSVSIGP
jgi:hypothetical protein